MRTFLERGLLVLVLAAMVGACTTSQQSAAPPQADHAAIQASIDSMDNVFNAAVAARDTETVVSFYAADARVLPPGAPMTQGQDGARKMWVEMLRMPGLSFTIHTNEVVTSEGGDLAIALGNFALKGQGPKGEFTDNGKYVTVFKKVDGGWKIAVDTFNSDAAPPSP